jgi:hypothetical protein
MVLVDEGATHSPPMYSVSLVSSLACMNPPRSETPSDIVPRELVLTET